MADSNITKRALALALKELMVHSTFSQISIGDICGKCQMNRKSFYYHFRDKFDLVNWIFQSECMTALESKEYHHGLTFLEDICAYLYTEHKFYQKALKITGQNSFRDYFKDLLGVFIAEMTRPALEDEQVRAFYINYHSEALVLAIENWMMSPSPAPPEEFVFHIKQSLAASPLLLGRKFHDMAKPIMFPFSDYNTAKS